MEEFTKHGYILTLGRYVISEVVEDEGFDEAVKKITAQLGEQFKKTVKLQKTVKVNLRIIGIEF